MKSIDLLVEELPKHGGWPDGVSAICQAHDLSLEKISECGDSYELGVYLSKLADNHRTYGTTAEECGAEVVTFAQYVSALSAKNEGWINWYGGECPVTMGTLVDVKYRDGGFKSGLEAGTIQCGRDSSRSHWSNNGYSCDIIAYRLHKPEVKAVEWDGAGSPPVGVECEYQDYKGDWHKIFIISRYGDGTFIEWRYSGVHEGCDLIRGEVSPDKFRPLRTESERKRDRIIHSLSKVLARAYSDAGDDSSTGMHIYNAIACGEIEGVRLEGN